MTNNMSWQSIEDFICDDPIWILKYDMYYIPGGEFCKKDDLYAEKFTSCHGWYGTEAEAMAVLRHFPQPNSYRVEKVHRRKLKINS